MRNYFNKKSIALIFELMVLIIISLAGCASGDNSNVSSTPEIDTSEYYDYLLCSGGGYSIVAKQEETVKDVVEYIGVLDENYNWVIELAANTPLHSDGYIPYAGYSSFESRCDTMEKRLHYAGNGVFIYARSKMTMGGDSFYEATSWNIPENSSDTSGRIRTNSLVLKDDYIMMADVSTSEAMNRGDAYVIMMDKSGKFIKTDIFCGSVTYIGQYAEGVFFSYDGFYDVNGNLVIDLSEYAGLIKNRPYFNNGECRLVAENENGTEFAATIDLNGNFISEFTKIDN